MVKERKKEQEEQPQQPQQEKRRGGWWKRLLALALVLLAVLAAAVFSTMEDGLHFAALRRWLMYGESGQTQALFTYASHPGNRFALLGKELLVVNPNAMRLICDDGLALYDLSAGMTCPSLSVGDKLAAVCDVGGSDVYVLDRSGVVRTLKTEGELFCFSARMNGEDYLAVTEQKSGYKAAASIYNPAGELLFHFDSHECYLADASVTDDNKFLAALALDTSDGAFSSRYLVYSLSTAERVADVRVADGLVLDFSLRDQVILSVCDSRLNIAAWGGETLLDLSYGSLYLHNYALGGKDFCALLLGRYQAGNICTLSTYSLNGETLGTLELTEEVLDISAAGDRLAVLYDDRLVLYDRTLAETACLEGTDYASQVQMAEDGTALLISGTSAWRFLP